jgi:predicted XRE-type DNA-binding protein
LDRQAKGRSKNLFTSENHPARLRAGESHWRAKLSAADVVRIRELHTSGLSQTHISTMFNVHSATISRIVRREWRREVA